MESEFIDVFWNIRDAVICVGFLVGIGAGIFLVVRKQKISGILAMLGFCLFGLEPIADFIVYRVLYKQDYGVETYQTFDYVYLCISAPAFFLGSIALVIAFINMMKSSQNPSNNLPVEN